MAAFDPNDPRLVYRPDIDQPKEGAVTLLDRWWCWHPERGAILYRSTPKSRYLSPQCNSQENCAEAVRARIYPWAELRRIPIAYLRSDEQGYTL